MVCTIGFQASCTTHHSEGYTECTPTRGWSPSGKIRKCELYGKRFTTTEEAWNAMRERGYTQAYFRRPSAFIRLYLSPRSRRHARWLLSAHGERTALEWAISTVRTDDSTGYLDKVLNADYFAKTRADWIRYIAGINDR